MHSVPVVSDFAAILARAQRGEPAAFRLLYEDLVRPVAAYLHSRGGHDVEDLVSEVFLGVFTGISRFSGGQGEFRSWVFSIVHRKLVDQWRHAGRTPHTVPYEVALDHRASGSAEQEAFAALGQERLQRLLDELTDDQRDVLLLRIVADLSIEQVAATLGKRPGAIKQLQRRGLLSLRRALAVEGVTS